MNSSNQQLALQIATAGPLRLPEPYLPPHVTERLPPELTREILDAMRADNEDTAGNLAVMLLSRMIDATSKTGNGSAVLAAVLGCEWLLKDSAGPGVSRQAVSKRAIQIRRALGLPPLACPGNARPKKQKAGITE